MPRKTSNIRHFGYEAVWVETPVALKVLGVRL